MVFSNQRSGMASDSANTYWLLVSFPTRPITTKLKKRISRDKKMLWQFTKNNFEFRVFGALS